MVREHTGDDKTRALKKHPNLKNNVHSHKRARGVVFGTKKGRGGNIVKKPQFVGGDPSGGGATAPCNRSNKTRTARGRSQRFFEYTE